MQIDGKFALAVIAAIATGLGGFFAAKAGLETRIAGLERKLLAVQNMSLRDFVVQEASSQLEARLDEVPPRRTDQEITRLIDEGLENLEDSSYPNEEVVRSWINSELLPLQAFSNMKGAVIAFDRSEDRGGGQAGGACPLGWALFRPAGGRFIVGAGSHQNLDGGGKPLEDYRPYSDDRENATGGFEQVTLTRDQMPSHNHPAAQVGLDASGAQLKVGNVGTPGSITMPYGFGFSSYVKDSATDRVVDDRGGDQPHENMPPYIALYFCKKE